MSADFTADQKRYLEGFVTGVQALRASTGAPGFGRPAGGAIAAGPAAPMGPDAIHIEAQNATVAKGGKLSDQEKWKRDEHPFDAYPRFVEQAAKDQFPKPADNFRWRYYGLFFVAPNQNSYMVRLRIPNGVLKHWQFAGVADLAEAYGFPHAHVTTRANLQFRGILAKDTVHVVEGLSDIGLTARGSGADNIRNVTGDATAGIAPGELLDTRPYARQWHFHILNDRALYGLPRKFNVAYDGGGPIPTLEDTNDIGFQAVQVLEGASFAGEPIPPGVYFRLILGGISGHRDLARDTGVILTPAEATGVADAIVRVFIREGNRTDRNKSRLKYVLDRQGFETFLEHVETELKRKLWRVDPALVAPRPVQDRHAHIGFHPQKQAGLFYCGVVLPVGKMPVEQMRALADLSKSHGDGEIRLTVWQNFLISGIREADIETVKTKLVAIGVGYEASAIRAGLVACTGMRGCRFASADTKGDAERIAEHLEPRLTMDTPINIHVTGCHNSCAQHYIGDIGLISVKVPVNEDGDTVPGYHIVAGGGFSDTAGIAREVFHDVTAEDAPLRVEGLLKAYLAHRAGPDENFHAFAGRHEPEHLARLAEETA
jgi:ferredoxin-nitrite reductase